MAVISRQHPQTARLPEHLAPSAANSPLQARFHHVRCIPRVSSRCAAEVVRPSIISAATPRIRQRPRQGTSAKVFGDFPIRLAAIAALVNARGSERFVCLRSNRHSQSRQLVLRKWRHAAFFERKIHRKTAVFCPRSRRCRFLAKSVSVESRARGQGLRKVRIRVFPLHGFNYEKWGDGIGVAGSELEIEPELPKTAPIEHGFHERWKLT